MKDEKRKKLEANTRNLLELLGEDPNREGLMNTPKRVVGPCVCLCSH
jgi:GTP cyclohydrolase I